MLIRAQHCPSKWLFLKTLSWSNSHWAKCNAEGRLPMVLKESLCLSGIWVFLWWNSLWLHCLFSSPCWGASVFSLPLLTHTDNSSNPYRAIFTQVHFQCRAMIRLPLSCRLFSPNSFSTYLLSFTKTLLPASSLTPHRGSLQVSHTTSFLKDWGMAHVRDLTSTTCYAQLSSYLIESQTGNEW